MHNQDKHKSVRKARHAYMAEQARQAERDPVHEARVATIRRGTPAMWFICFLFALALAIGTAITFIALTTESDELPTRVYQVDNVYIGLKLPTAWTASEEGGRLLCSSASGGETLTIDTVKYESANAAASMLALETGSTDALSALMSTGLWTTVADGALYAYCIAQEIDGLYIVGIYKASTSASNATAVPEIMQSVHIAVRDGAATAAS